MPIDSQKPIPRWQSAEGSLMPLGASWIPEERAWNFVLYSVHAERVTVLLYREDDLHTPAFQFEFNSRQNKSGPLWHCRIPADAAPNVRFYAYRIDGPAPGPGFDWHCFHPEKLLLDPCAKTVFFPPDFDRQAAIAPGANDGRAPLGVLEYTQCGFDWGDDRPVRHDADLIIYELHVRGFTKHSNSGVSDEKRGTFLGVVEKIPYLKELGITAVELMPVFQFDPQEQDYWGYMPLNFFAPHHEYSTDLSACRQRNEFREMVKALHAADIEVILDVVYNHTCEGDHKGPIYSLKGIDNSSAYLFSGDSAAPYSNFSGTGNTLHTANRAVRRLIIDSIRYWAEEMHVDGFRFDLASIFTRRSDGSINLDDPPIFAEVTVNTAVGDIRLIAEPWDAKGAFQLGRKFPGATWRQWNAAYRDAVQRFVRGDRGVVRELMTRLYGSCDLFPDDRLNACRPYQSVNYVTSHDGFSMYDLVSYNQKHNWANGHNNTDGANEYSWNGGLEGEDGASEEILQLRRQQIRNFFCLLLLSNGTPMFRMGDEFLQTQNGNNNPYNQDNETSWLNWKRLEANTDIFRFVKRMISFRKAHPSLCRSQFWRDDIRWYGTDRLVDLSSTSQTLAFCLHGASQLDVDIYVMINASTETQRFGIYEGEPGDWGRMIDTSLPSPTDIMEPGDEESIRDHSYRTNPRSVVVMLRQRQSQ